MRKIRYILSVARMGVMLSGCQLILFPENQTEDSGGQQNQTPDDGRKDEEDPILKVRTLGMYNIDGKD